MAARLATLAMGAALLVGCGSERTAGPAEDRTPRANDVEVVVETVPIPTVLPPEMCFVGIHDYDVMLQGANLGAPDACAKLAARLFPRVEQLGWSPSAVEGPDWVAECVLSRGGARLAVARDDPDAQGPRFERAYALAEGACERLRRERWTDARTAQWDW